MKYGIEHQPIAPSMIKISPKIIKNTLLIPKNAAINIAAPMIERLIRSVLLILHCLKNMIHPVQESFCL